MVCKENDAWHMSLKEEKVFMEEWEKASDASLLDTCRSSDI